MDQADVGLVAGQAGHNVPLRAMDPVRLPPTATPSLREAASLERRRVDAVF